MDKPTQTNTPSDENKLNQNSIFKNIPQNILAESQATMRSIILAHDEHEIPKIKCP